MIAVSLQNTSTYPKLSKAMSVHYFLSWTQLLSNIKKDVFKNFVSFAFLKIDKIAHK